jgi:cell division protein FtsN
MAVKRNGKQAYRENERQSWPAWVWLGLGVLLGLTLSAIMLVKEWVPMLHRKNLPQPNPEATAPKESDQAVADEAGKKPAPPKKTYDFYSVLPEMEVVIPDAELSAKAKAEQQRQQAAMAQAQAQTSAGATSPTTPPASDSSGHYLLQAASTTDAKAADELKARLSLLGFTVKIYTININGKVYNRVRVGPFSTASDTEAARKTLTDSGINAIPIAEKPGQ